METAWRDGDWYDADYWDHPAEGGKSGFTGTYTWERLGGYFQQTAGHMMAKFAPTSVLDLGCGRGLLVKALRERAVAWGVDFSGYAVATAPADVQPFLEVADVTDRLPDGPFDLVSAFDLLEHIPEQRVAKLLEGIAGRAGRWVVAHVGLADYPEPGYPDVDGSHCNMQTRGWWESKFTEHLTGFEACDPVAFSDPGVWWFNVPAGLFVYRRGM